MPININLDAKETFKHILGKLSSGRWIQTVAFTLTYCIGIVGSVVMVIKGIMKLETFLAMWSGFTAMVMLINEWYFKREDRKTENGKGGVQ